MWGWGWSQERHHFPLFMGHPNWDTVVRQSDVTSKAPFPWEVCICVCLCAHMVFKLSCLPCGFLCCFLPERPRLPGLARPPPPPWTHLRRRTNVEVRPPVLSPAQTRRFGALDGRNFPLPPPSSHSAASSWGRVGENAAKLYLLHHIRIYSLFFVLFCTTCLPTDSDLYLVLWQWHRCCIHNIPATCRGKST